MPPIRIELLGKLRVTAGQRALASVNTNRLQSLLAFLVLHAEAAQSREHLAFLLWPESAESQARTNLRQLLHHLRRALAGECSLLAIDNQTVHWRPECPWSVDVTDFGAAAARAMEAEQKGNLTLAREAFEEAARLYQDDLLPDLYDDWLQTRREQLRQQFADVLSRLAALLENLGDYSSAIQHAGRLVALDPLREPSYQLLMRLHVLSGDRASALRVYHQCMRTLQRELGISPSKATQDLFTQALKSDPRPAAPAEPPPDAASSLLPLVGRAREWDGLLGCWRRVTQGDTRLALILGEPGIGKSRLAEELFQSCSRRPEGAAARARCYSAQRRLAYGPVAEWLRAEPLRSARTQLPKPQLTELARVLPEILIDTPDIAPPKPLTESWQRRHLYEALNAAFRRSPRPLLLLIDDLQWCDQDSFEWLHSFFRSEAAAHTLVLGTVRPEETRRDHPFAALVNELRQSGQVSEFPIEPLGNEETGALAAQVAGRECEPKFLSGLYQVTGGNPLFIVETVRASLEDQEAKNTVPPRVQAVIAARLAQLSPSPYELAGLAAAIGRPFSLDLLAKATDWDEDSVSRALEELWQHRIIAGQGTGAYDYTHDLLREVAYTELSPVRRRALHRRIARALEELYGPDLQGISGWLADHYDAAGMAEQAISYYRTAATVAKHRFADAEAAHLIRRALFLCREFPETARRDREELELLLTLGPSLVSTQGYSMPEVGETYERGLLLTRRSGDQTQVFSVLSGAWLFRTVRGELEDSRRLAQQCIDEACGDGAAAQQMAGRFLLGTSLFHLGQLAESRRQIEQALSSYTGSSHPALALFAGPDVGVFCRSYLSHVLWQLDETEEAAAKSEEAIALARQLSHPFGLAIALDYAALFDVLRHDAKGVLDRAGEAAVLCRRHGFVYYLAWAEILVGWAAAVEDDPAAGLVQLRHGLEALKATGAELRLPFYYGLLAEVHGLAGQAGEALANVASAFAFQNKNGELWTAPELHRIHGDLLLRTGDAAGAQDSYQCAIEAARQTGARLFELKAATRLRELSTPQQVRRNAAER